MNVLAVACRVLGSSGCAIAKNEAENRRIRKKYFFIKKCLLVISKFHA
jgi:hypothetical protein